MIVCCSWCHESVDLDRDGSCPACGHDAGVCRMECGCVACHAQRLMADVDTADPPLVAGGCGRSARELSDTALICMSLASVGVVIAIVSLVAS